jgi:putative ABC transport system permease protein
MPRGRYPEPKRVQFFERLTTNLSATPGIESAAAASFVPVGGGGYGLGRVFLLDGQPEPPSSHDHPAQWNVITPDYFRTMGIPLLRGRAFTWADTSTTTQVVIINQTMARRVFGDADPIGRRMRSWRDENVYRQIVGVVADVRYWGLPSEDASLVYVPYAQDWWGLMRLTVRAQSNPAVFADTLRREVARLDPDIAVAQIRPLREMADESIAAHRFGAMLLAVFAIAAAILAGVGVYGVMSYAVTQRRHEFGVRLALGATPGNVFRMILRRGLLLAAFGSALGVAGGFALAPVMRGLLSGIGPFDRVTFAVVPLVLLAVAFAACAVPGMRAARTTPLEALRE